MLSRNGRPARPAEGGVVTALRLSVHARRVRVLRERGELKRIVAMWRKADTDERAWQDLGLVLELARTYSLLGNEARVEQYFERCVELNPGRAALYHCQIGWYFQRKRRWLRALRWYDRALETFPGYHLCLFRRGFCLERLHRPLAAVESFEAAARVYEEATEEQKERARTIQIQVLFHLARNLRDTGRSVEARDALERCTVLDRSGSELVVREEHLLASLAEIDLTEGRPGPAIEHLEKARTLDERSPVTLERLGRAYELVGRSEEAESALRLAVELPRGEVAFIALAAFLRRAARFEEAASAISDALERHPRGEVAVRIELAEIHLALGRPRTAVEELQRLATGRVPRGSAQAALVERRIAEVLLDHGQNERAIGHLRAAARQEATGAEERRGLLERAGELEREVRGEEGRPLEDANLPDAVARALAQERPRVEGSIVNYVPERGFGFIAATAGGENVFFHVSQWDSREAEPPSVGDEVSFVIGVNERNRRRQAERVRRRTPSN
jgi:tetratricopeptide (TPR) repeat protein/cold shock CspA family protein